jgi:hypothetical protein
MTQTPKYDLDLTDYSVTGWNGILKGSIEDIDDHVHSRLLVTLGETVAKGEALYLKSDGKYWKAKAVATQSPTKGVAIEAGNADDEIRIQRVGLITVTGWSWSGGVGTKLYLSGGTDGALTETRPLKFAQQVGYVISATSAFLFVEEPSPIHFGYEASPATAGWPDGILYAQLPSTTTTTTTTT